MNLKLSDFSLCLKDKVMPQISRRDAEIGFYRNDLTPVVFTRVYISKYIIIASAVNRKRISD
jgi:hypothetical protein